MKSSNLRTQGPHVLQIFPTLRSPQFLNLPLALRIHQTCLRLHVEFRLKLSLSLKSPNPHTWLVSVALIDAENLSCVPAHALGRGVFHFYLCGYFLEPLGVSRTAMFLVEEIMDE